jgi:hypothetical protein
MVERNVLGFEIFIVNVVVISLYASFSAVGPFSFLPSIGTANRCCYLPKKLNARTAYKQVIRRDDDYIQQLKRTRDECGLRATHADP